MGKVATTVLIAAFIISSLIILQPAVANTRVVVVVYTSSPSSTVEVPSQNLTDLSLIEYAAAIAGIVAIVVLLIYFKRHK